MKSNESESTYPTYEEIHASVRKGFNYSMKEYYAMRARIIGDAEFSHRDGMIFLTTLTELRELDLALQVCEAAGYTSYVAYLEAEVEHKLFCLGHEY